MAKPASSKSGDKSSKGAPPTRNTRKKAPLATSEEFSEEESDEDKLNKKKAKAATKAALKKAPKPPSSEQSENDGNQAKTSKKNSKTKKKTKEEEMLDTIAIVFDIKNESIHSFIFMELTGLLILGHVVYQKKM